MTADSNSHIAWQRAQLKRLRAALKELEVDQLGKANCGRATQMQMDELQRKIQLEAMAFAFALTAVLSLAYGFLELFANFPEVNWVWVWPLLGACQAAGIVMGRRRYR